MPVLNFNSSNMNCSKGMLIFVNWKILVLNSDTFYPPTIIERQDKVEVRLGKGANLTCTANGNPKPQVKWLTDQEKSLTEVVDWKAILFLTDVTEPRVYICVANNSLGRVQHLVRVEIIGKNMSCLLFYIWTQSSFY